MEWTTFDLLIVLLGVTFFVTVLFRYLRLPSIVGYIFVGLILGPHTTGMIQDDALIERIAEFGIVFLLFTIGLEFSLSKLSAMRSIVLGYGSLQVLITGGLTIFAGVCIGLDLPAAIVVGMVVSMSSTAIVLKILSDQSELYLRHGHNAVGILLMQDLIVVPFLILIPSLKAVDLQSLAIESGIAIVKGIYIIALILIIGRSVLRPLFRRIAQLQSVELFTLTTLLVALSSAWLTHTIGLSLALGAFLAGIMLGETEFRHQIDTEVRPFRDILLGLFFITIGMQFDIFSLNETWSWILLLLAAMIFFKIIIISLLGLALGHDRITSLRTGLILAQGGEFGFAILATALSYKVLPEDYGQVVLGALLISMALSPIIIRYNRPLTRYLFKKTSKVNLDDSIKTATELSEHLEDHAIICGFGRIGQNIARLLQHENLQYIALDMDAKRVQEAGLAGDNVTYGNAANYEMLRAIGVDRAKAIVICINDESIVSKIITQVRQMNKQIAILVRSHDDKRLTKYLKEGATEIIPETQETSLVLGSHLLLVLGVSAVKVYRDMESARRDRYAIFRKVFPGTEILGEDGDLDTSERLRNLYLSQNAKAIGKALGELELETIPVEVVSIQRQGISLKDFNQDTMLEANDVIVLFGDPKQLFEAESKLL